VSAYPIALVHLEDARCIVVGGGAVAARKVTALREGGARPIVISPALCDPLCDLAQDGEIQVIERTYRPGDLDGARVVIAATDDPGTNHAVYEEAVSAGCLVNVVDDPAHCTFYVPATVRRGTLTISISTGGHSPSLARRIREALEMQFDAAYGPYLSLLGTLRPVVRDRIADAVQRKALWAALLDSDILDLLRDGTEQAARQRALEIIDSFC
jgi:precorrin-2 dehydrogenase/sirohydrochlorin ferrochelatase